MARAGNYAGIGIELASRQGLCAKVNEKDHCLRSAPHSLSLALCRTLGGLPLVNSRQVLRRESPLTNRLSEV